MLNRWLTGILVAVIITGCVEEDCPQKDKRLVLNASIEETRITKQSFGPGDFIGIYLVDYVNDTPGLLGDISRTENMNQKYTYDGNFWRSVSGEDIYLPDTYADLYSYYPYDEELSRVPGKTNLTAYPFRIDTDQNAFSHRNDFLWAKIPRLSANNNMVNIPFQHLMSRCEINLRFPNGMPSDNSPDLTVYNTKISCTINLRTGVVTALEGTDIIKPYINFETTNGFDITYDVILIPQIIPAGTPLFTINNGTNVLLYETEREIEIKSQALYMFNLTVREEIADE